MTASKSRFAKPALEEFEPRRVPAALGGANPTYQAECLYLDGLIPSSAITITAQRSGDWSDPATWGGRLPATGDNAWIPNGLTVTVDGREPGSLRSILDNGTLQFATTVNTSLTVDTLVVGTDDNPSGLPEGTLTIGTAADPVRAGVTAVLTFADGGPLATVFPDDWNQMSRGLISMGTVSIYGSQVTPYVGLAQNAVAGDTVLTLARAPVGWSVGDTLLLPGTSAAANQDEQIRIQAIEGFRITLATPLHYNHTAPAGQSVQVADEARTVVLQSQNAADPTRHGHVMFMHTDQETVAYADFLNLGRTDKSVPLNNARLDAGGKLVPGTGTNEVGRYALHFHRDYWPTLSEADPPILVLGNYESGSPGWGYDNHSSNVDFENDVAFNNFGAAFATEAGNEIGTFNANLAVRTIGVPDGTLSPVIDSRSALNDFGFNGAGFWMQSPGCTLTNNVATDDQVGFNYYNLSLNEEGLGRIQFWTANATDAAGYEYPLVDTRAVQIPLFSGNTASEATDGLQLFWNLPITMPVPAGVHSVIDHLAAWDVTNGVVAGNWTGRLTVQDSTLTANGAAPGVGVESFGAGYVSNINVIDTTVVGFGTGEILPTRGQNRVAGGYWDNPTNFEITTQVSNLVSDRQIQFSGPITFGPHSRLNYNLESQRTQDANPNEDFATQQILLPDGRELYFADQGASYVPFPATNSSVPAQLVGLTSRQIWSEYGIATEGVVAPDASAAYAGSNGIAGAPQAVPAYYRLVSPLRVSSGPSYTLQYQSDPAGVVITDPTPVTLQPGWNVISRAVEGVLYSWLVDYNVPARLATLSLSGLSGPQLTGTPVTVTVSAEDAGGAVVPGYLGTVAFSSSDGRAALPAGYTFTAADRGVHSFSVTFNTAGTQSFAVTDVAGGITARQTGIVVHQPAPGPVLLKDALADADGTLIQSHTMDVGPGWTVWGGSWVIQNNRLNLTDNGGHSDLLVADAGRSDVTTSLNFTTANQSDTGIAGLVVRAADDQDYWLVYLHNTQLIVYQVKAGQWSMMAESAIVPIAPNATYALKAVASGQTITGYVNGVQYVQYTAATFLQTATKHGIFCYRDPAGAQPLVPVDHFECDTNSVAAPRAAARRVGAAPADSQGPAEWAAVFNTDASNRKKPGNV